MNKILSSNLQKESQKIYNSVFKSEDILNTLLAYGAKFLFALLILFIGTKIIKFFVKFVTKNFIRKKIDVSLQSFLISLIKISLYLLLGLVIAQTAGIKVTSFIAVIASASFAVGLALQGSLSNFAGGIIILLLKPFKVGDYIEALNISGIVTNVSGTVHDIHLFYTVLNTPDNKRITIPNSNLSNCSTINYTTNATRRIDFNINVDGRNDFVKTKTILSAIIDNNNLVLKDPAYQVALTDHNSKTMLFIIKVWCNTEDYWQIYYEVMEQIKLEFERNNIVLEDQLEKSPIALDMDD